VMLTSLVTPYLLTGQALPRTGNTGYSGAPTAAMFQARDGVRLSLGVVQDNQFNALCRAIDLPHLIEDPRFATIVERAKPENAERLRDLLNAVFATRDAGDWERLLNSAGAPCGLVRDVAAASEAARQGDRGLIEDVGVRLRSGEQVTGAFVNAGFVFQTDGPGGVGSVPVLGEHSRKILTSLGYSDQESDALIDAHIVRDRT
jgi:CoA:oxalate CoA-transferase